MKISWRLPAALLCAGAFFALCMSVNAQSNDVVVVNASPLPVVIAEQSQSDLYPAFGLGFGCGLTFFGFGWILRMAKNSVRPDNG